jgi:DMSO/TMAO reductase YedYZ molybdopterin-dependent catalytic subunit
MNDPPATADALGTPVASRPPTARESSWAGFAAGALGLAVGSLVAAITDVIAPFDAVGTAVINLAPGWLERWAIDTFGTANKLVLRAGVLAVVMAMAALIGRVMVRRRRSGLLGVVAVSTLGIIASVAGPDEGAGAAVPTVVGAVCAVLVMRVLLRPRHVEIPGRSRAPLGIDRRRALAGTVGTLAGAVVAAMVGDGIRRSRVDDYRATTAAALPPLDPSTGDDRPIDIDEFAGAEVDPSTPFITPVDDFYRIDTVLSFPRVEVASWRLTIDGLVDRPSTLSYDDLLAMPQVERAITLCCVSNEIGGPLVGTAVWRGVMLRDLLEAAGISGDATQVFSTSADGWTCGFPVAAALDGRDALVALGMNGAALPLEHGYPARLVVPGLYGYVSATKWLERIELTTWDREGFWIPRGWAREAPVRTQSRIGHPRNGERLDGGAQRIAGVAWAQGRGIERVEVRVDEGPWIEATLADDVSDDTWRQWTLDWTPTSGRHSISVRATDKAGDTQVEQRTPVAPDGATGHHTITVDVG